MGPMVLIVVVTQERRRRRLTSCCTEKPSQASRRRATRCEAPSRHARVSTGGDAVAAEVTAIIRAARPVVAPWEDDLLLGVILEGNVGDAMPEGYMDTMANPP